MKVITISKKKLDSLELFQLPKEVINTEARIYRINYHGQDKILKDLYFTSGEMFGSKLFTIESLDTNKEYLPESFVIPDSLVSVNGNIRGFTIPFINGINLQSFLSNKKVSIKEQIYYLKKVGELLEQLKNIREHSYLNDIYINDLQSANFIVTPNNGGLKTIDLDSCKISSNSIFAARYMTERSLIAQCNQPKYERVENPRPNSGIIVPNDDTEIYCFIMMILNYLYDGNVSSMDINTFYAYLNYLDSLGVDKDLLDTFEKIIRYESNTNPVYYLDSLTDQQIYRSGEKIFKLARKK